MNIAFTKNAFTTTESDKVRYPTGWFDPLGLINLMESVSARKGIVNRCRTQE